MKCLILHAFLLLLFCEVIYTRFDYLEDAKIHVLDYKYYSDKDINRFGILFRTNTPLDYNGVFDYNNFFDKLAYAAARERQIQLTKERAYFVIYNLIGDDEDVVTKERHFFEANPTKGEVRYRPMLGEQVVSPEFYSQKEIKMKVSNMSWMVDDMDGIVTDIRRTLITAPPSHINNLIIIIHCRRGKDRTGQVSGGYQMKYGHKSWEQTQALNWEVYNGRLVYQHQRALLWYCYQLKYQMNYSALTCTHENVSPEIRSKPVLLGWNAPLYYQLTGLTLSVLLATLLISVIVNCFLVQQFLGKRIAEILILAYNSLRAFVVRNYRKLSPRK